MNGISLAEIKTQLSAGICPGPGVLKRLKADPRKSAQALHTKALKLRGALRKEAARLDSMLQFERELTAEGFQAVAGVDEAGRGPLAGPIVAAAVVLAGPVQGLNDSKLLRAAQREELFAVLESGGHGIGIAIIEATDIDRMGIQQANYQAMVQAVGALPNAADFVLVDGFSIPGLAAPHKKLIKGDRRSQSIAAASIIAKVTRDRIMAALDAVYPLYGFLRHQGYGTKVHLEALALHGPCPVHRHSFAPIAQALEQRELFDY